MSIAAALAYEAEIEKMMRLMERRESLRAPAVSYSDSTLTWQPMPYEPDQQFQEMMQHLRHSVAQEMAVPEHLLRAQPQSAAQELRQRQQEEMMRIHLRPDGGFEEEARLFRERVLGEMSVPREEPEEEKPVARKYGRMLEP